MHVAYLPRRADKGAVAMKDANDAEALLNAPEPREAVSGDGSSVEFKVVAHGRDIRCSISRKVLEAYFWLPVGAAEARMIRAFIDGRSRIVALAERKALCAAGETVVLTAKDFERR